MLAKYSSFPLFLFMMLLMLPGMEGVAYQTDNILSNNGEHAWTKDGGLLSIWMLCMFNPTVTTTVFIPFRQDTEGVVVDGTIYFKIDGKLRSKIGLPYERAKELCGSYNSEKKVLTLLWCSLPSVPRNYVNSKWGPQEDPYNGDAIAGKF